MKSKKKPVGTKPAPESLTPYPRSDELAAGIERCQAVAFAEKLIRVASMDYANRDDLLSGEGSVKYGGRYNPKGGFRAIYGSLELDTATAELLAHYRQQGRPDPEADVFPFVAVSLEAEVERLLDLTDTAIRRALKVSLKDLVGDWQNTQDLGQEALTQAIGRLARAAGYQGLLAPSAAKPGGRNVALFRDNVPKSQLRIIRKHKLPKKT
jgi:RES domain-containing protein